MRDDLEAVASKLGISLMKGKGDIADRVVTSFSEFAKEVTELDASFGVGHEVIDDDTSMSYVAIKHDPTDQLLLVIIIPDHQE